MSLPVVGSVGVSSLAISQASALVEGIASIIKSNNDTKVALRQIEADLEKKLREIDSKHIKDMNLIETFSKKLDSALMNEKIDASIRLDCINLFTNALLSIGGYK